MGRKGRAEPVAGTEAHEALAGEGGGGGPGGARCARCARGFVLVSAEADGQEEEEEEIGAEGEEAGGIVPAMGGGEPGAGREGTEEDGAQAIGEKGEANAAGE